VWGKPRATSKGQAIASRPARQKAARSRCKRPNRGTTSRRCARQMHTPLHQLFPARDTSRCLGSSTPPFYLHTNSIDSRIHRIVLIYTLDRDTQPWRKPCSSLRHFIVWDITPPPTFRPAGRSHRKLLLTKASAKARRSTNIGFWDCRLRCGTIPCYLKHPVNWIVY